MFFAGGGGGGKGHHGSRKRKASPSRDEGKPTKVSATAEWRSFVEFL